MGQHTENRRQGIGEGHAFPFEDIVCSLLLRHTRTASFGLVTAISFKKIKKGHFCIRHETLTGCLVTPCVTFVLRARYRPPAKATLHPPPSRHALW